MSDTTKVWGRGLILKAPPTHYSILFITFEGLLLSLTKYLVSGIYLTFALTPILILNPFVAKLLITDRNFTLKRAFYIYVYLNTPLTLILIVDFIQPVNSISSIIFLATITVISYLLLLVLIAGFKANIFKGALITATFVATYDYFTLEKIGLLTFLLDYMLTILTALIIRERISSIRLGSVNGLELINSFAMSWMDRSSYAFDDLCKKVGQVSELNVSIHEFKNNNDKIATIIVPYIHPGPAKSIGSGELPSIIHEILSEHRPLVFHGASDHSLNIASRQDTRDLVRLIEQTITTSTAPFTKLDNVGYAESHQGKIKLSVYEFSGNKLGFISKEDSTEDLPMQITRMVNSGLDLIDRHNTLCDQASAQYNADQVMMLTQMINEATGKPLTNFSIKSAGYANRRLDVLDIAPGGISALVLNGDRKVAFISIDANNLSCGLNKKIEEAVKSMGYEFCEVTTTDNHWNSGITRKEPGYYTGGSLSANELLESIVKCVKQAEETMYPTFYRKITVVFKATVFGDKLDEMYSALSIGRKFIFIGVFFCLVVSLILGLI
ncbi:MAG TPA: DUF2070 family protein [bacterium]|nr:DUF2070 family protein [bacterium]